MEMELEEFLEVVWDKLGGLSAFECFSFCLMAFMGFVFISIHWLVGLGERGFRSLIVPGRALFWLLEDFSFVL